MNLGFSHSRFTVHFSKSPHKFGTALTHGVLIGPIGRPVYLPFTRRTPAMQRMSTNASRFLASLPRLGGGWLANQLHGLKRRSHLAPIFILRLSVSSAACSMKRHGFEWFEIKIACALAEGGVVRCGLLSLRRARHLFVSARRNIPDLLASGRFISGRVALKSHRRLAVAGAGGFSGQSALRSFLRDEIPRDPCLLLRERDAGCDRRVAGAAVGGGTTDAGHAQGIFRAGWLGRDFQRDAGRGHHRGGAGLFWFEPVVRAIVESLVGQQRDGDSGVDAVHPHLVFKIE